MDDSEAAVGGTGVTVSSEGLLLLLVEPYVVVISLQIMAVP